MLNNSIIAMSSANAPVEKKGVGNPPISYSKEPIAGPGNQGIKIIYVVTSHRMKKVIAINL